MLFSEFTHYLDKLEQISSKNEMVKILSELILSLDEGEISRALYLSLGQLGPLYDSILFNMSDKLIIQAISEYSGVNEENISGKLSNIGDAGLVSAEYANSNGGSGMNILEVFDALKDIAMAHGEGSVKEKINKTASLMKPMSEAESKYVVRIILERLRMGIAEATIMDALSWAKTESKSDRKIIESAFNVYPDIGYIAETYMKEGVEGMTSVNISPGIPIRPAQSERLPTPEKIIDKLEQFAIEPKMDGFRAQIHVWGSGQDRTARIFSRNLNETTEMFPEIIEAIKLLPIESGIFDSEAIAYNPETGEFLPFQETVKRRRKHGVEEKSQEIPLRAFIFDVLYLDGVDLISVGAQERFEKLSALPFDDNTLSLTRHTIVNELSEFRKLFDQYVSEGLEGIMCKKLDSEYQAGSRNYNWVKYKRATERELSDTIDAVIMGYYAGRGQRAKFGVGAFLIGLIDPDSGKIQTLAKVGTGLSDDDWISLKKEMDMYQVVEMPATYSVHPNLTPDVWIRPALVVEVGADEITKSPIHTAAQNIIQEKDFEGGLALRFPRFKKLRQDRTGIDTTTTEELANMFKMQNEK